MTAIKSNTWNHGCSGGMLINALKYASEFDIFDEQTYKYKGYDGQCTTVGLKPKSRARLPVFS